MCRAGFPNYARVDLTVRHEFRWGSWKIEPYLSVPNVTGRTNPYGYFPRTYKPNRSANGSVDRLARGQIPMFPFVGVGFRF